MASEREYFWLVVFEWSHKTLSPFQIHVYNPTFTGIIPQEWIVGKLIKAHIVKKFRISSLNKEIPYSFFCEN